MNSDQEAKVSMYLKVQQFLLEKLAVLTALFSIITDYKTDLDDFIADILEADALATADTTGYTEAKQTKRDQMTTLALRISGGGAAYYKALGDSGSQDEIYFTETEFVRAQDTVAYTKAMQVFRLANAAGAALIPHGITVADISNLNLFSQQYLAILQLPKRKVSAKAAQGKKVDTLMKETDDFLDETLDPQMRVMKDTANQELLDEYEGNRGIDDNPSGGNGITADREADVTAITVASIDVSGIKGAFASRVLGTITGTLRFFASDSPTGILGPSDTFYEVTDASFDKTLTEFGGLVGFSGSKIFLRVQNTTGSTAHYKLTFTHLAP